ncbi:hypothetical protein R5R35_004142 [Gryllus longicercus]|uniref:Uncharacterized protein n=1 Tax=Gryllus longicercus TaxID=2509291 RepID=A0AAN9VQQ1_9ORTH
MAWGDVARHRQQGAWVVREPISCGRSQRDPPSTNKRRRYRSALFQPLFIFYFLSAPQGRRRLNLNGIDRVISQYITREGPRMCNGLAALQSGPCLCVSVYLSTFASLLVVSPAFRLGHETNTANAARDETAGDCVLQ